MDPLSGHVRVTLPLLHASAQTAHRPLALASFSFYTTTSPRASDWMRPYIGCLL